VGFCLALSDLKDLRVKHRAIELLIATFDWRSGEQNVELVLGNLIKRYSDEREVTHLVDLFLNVDERYRAPLENAIASRFGVRALLRGVAVRVLARLRRSLRLRRA
jgi:hypothetical protein